MRRFTPDTFNMLCIFLALVLVAAGAFGVHALVSCEGEAEDTAAHTAHERGEEEGTVTVSLPLPSSSPLVLPDAEHPLSEKETDAVGRECILLIPPSGNPYLTESRDMRARPEAALALYALALDFRAHFDGLSPLVTRAFSDTGEASDPHRTGYVLSLSLTDGEERYSPRERADDPLTSAAITYFSGLLRDFGFTPLPGGDYLFCGSPFARYIEAAGITPGEFASSLADTSPASPRILDTPGGEERIFLLRASHGTVTLTLSESDTFRILYPGGDLLAVAVHRG